MSVMHYKFSATLVLLLTFFSFACAQNSDPVVGAVLYSTGDDSLARDSTQSFAAPIADSLFSDTSRSTSTVQNESQKLKLIKRKYNSRQQVLLATGMMIFVIGIMTMAQQWNPR